jgi:hypothetical protein
VSDFTINFAPASPNINTTFQVGGASTFLQLTDTPSSYSGQALKIVRVNAGETGLEFSTGGGGSGTVTTFSSGNLSPIFSTSVANPTSTPALSFSLSTQSGNLIFASPDGTTGAPTFRSIVAADLPSSVVTLTGAQSITNKKLGSLTSNGFVKTSGGDGTLSVDTSTYLTGNQNITVSGDISGSGTTAITLTLPTVNANVGTFNNVTVNAKGQVTAASNASYLTGNQSITISGDISGTGTTAITTAIGSNKVTLGMLSQVSTGTFHARVTAGTGNVESITGTQATTLLDTFTSLLKGLAPASGGGTTNFLRADGTWTTPPSSITLTGSVDEMLKYSTSTAAIGTKVYSSTNGNIILGDSALAGNRTITVASSATNAQLSISSKGAEVINYTGSQHLFTSPGGSSSAVFSIQNVSGNTGVTIQTPSSGYSSITGGSATTTNLGSYVIKGINASDSNNDGTHVHIVPGLKNGTGKDGNIALFTLPTNSFPETIFGSGGNVILIGPATTNPSTTVSGGGIFFVKAADGRPYWRTGSTEYSMTTVSNVIGLDVAINNVSYLM